MYLSPLLAEIDAPMRDLGYTRQPMTNRYEVLEPVALPYWTVGRVAV